MSEQKATGNDSLSEHQVVDYLRTHPEFFQHHDYLLNELTLPHPESGEAVSLIERQVAMLRDQRHDLKHQMQHLSQTARSNEQLLQRLQEFILNLIDTDNLHDTVAQVENILRHDFHTDVVSACLFGIKEQGSALRALDEQVMEQFSTQLKQGHPLCGHLRAHQLELLFGDKATDIASAVVIPLNGADKRILGLLGIGSIDPNRFHPTMGTEFISYLGDVLGRVLTRHLE